MQFDKHIASNSCIGAGDHMMQPVYLIRPHHSYTCCIFFTDENDLLITNANMSSENLPLRIKRLSCWPILLNQSKHQTNKILNPNQLVSQHAKLSLYICLPCTQCWSQYANPLLHIT